MADWLKEWALAISAGVTLLLAIAAFWTIWQSYRFRKKDRRRERSARAVDELCRWVDETLRLFYLPYSSNKEEIHKGLIEKMNLAVASTATAIILGKEFEGLVGRANKALTSYSGALQKKRGGDTEPFDKAIIEEFRVSFHGLQLYINLLRTWDYNYKAFIQDASRNSKLPLSKHLQPPEV
ncbi:hypothetical protein ES703_102625 [subsurface metagenome]